MKEQGTIQQELFQKKPIDTDQESFKECLKMLFRASEKVYSSRVVREALNEWEIEQEIEEDMRRFAEEDIEEDDF